jgi:hypothetical protein
VRVFVCVRARARIIALSVLYILTDCIFKKIILFEINYEYIKKLKNLALVCLRVFFRQFSLLLCHRQAHCHWRCRSATGPKWRLSSKFRRGPGGISIRFTRRGSHLLLSIRCQALLFEFVHILCDIFHKYDALQGVHTLCIKLRQSELKVHTRK